ncbi:hypothetical protein DYB32_010623, partial [Aphanomyces invadans]
MVAAAPASNPHVRTAGDFTYEVYDIDFSMHREHRDKLVRRMAALPSLAPSSFAVLHGGSEVSEYDQDTMVPFQQESMFQYLFGVKEPDCAGAIDLTTGRSILFVPRLSAEWAIWCGDRKPLDWFRSHYGVDDVLYADDMAAALDARGAKTLYVLRGVNLDSGRTTTTTSTFAGMDKFVVDTAALHHELVECRVIKTEKELHLLRWINKLTCEAHVQVMRTIVPGMMEYHAEATFLHSCHSKGGARFQAFTCICGSGHNAAALHYGHAGAPNDSVLANGDIFLNDMGSSYHGYVSDITCTFPVNGMFTADQAFIYNGVLDAHNAVLAAIKPGVLFTDLHILSHRILTAHLLAGGLLQNGTVDELMAAEITAFFYPCGLGHMMGLDLHDVGGYLPGTGRTDTRMLRKLRCGRVLETNMVVTVEPGCYFIEGQMDELLTNPDTAKYVNEHVLRRFRGFGGVRVESDVI